MRADRDLHNSSFNYIVAEKHGSGDLTQVNVSLNSSATLPYILSSNFEKKAAVSLEQIFRPISSKSGTTFPYLLENNTNFFAESYPYFLTSDVQETFNYGLIPTVGSGTEFITHEEIIDKDNRISDIDAKEIRSIGLALPIYGAGFGENKYGDSVGRGSPTNNDILNYKAGPIDLRWDDERNVWGMNSLLVKGYLSSDITAPIERNIPTQFTINTYKHSTSGTIDIEREFTLYNYDLHLSVSLATKCIYSGSGCTFEDEDIWVVGIGSIPIYIGSVNE